MSGRREVRREDYAVSRADGYVYQRGSAEHPYWEGHVTTPLGYVLVYIEGPDGLNISSFRAVVDGREHQLRLPRAVTPRGAARIAHRWIRELHGEG